MPFTSAIYTEDRTHPSTGSPQVLAVQPQRLSRLPLVTLRGQPGVHLALQLRRVHSRRHAPDRVLRRRHPLLQRRNCA